MAVRGCIAGTLIQTAAGLTPIEAIIQGEPVVTIAGEMMPVIRVIRRRFAWAINADTVDIRPVRIMRGAIAPDVPNRDLLLAPDQILPIRNHSLSAERLINDVTIDRHHEVTDLNPTQQITYFEIQLERRAAVLANGVHIWCLGNEAGALSASETSLGWGDTHGGGRGAMDSGAEAQAAFHFLSSRTAQLGYSLTDDPDLTLLVNGTIRKPDSRSATGYRFSLPERTTRFELVSKTFVPNRIRNDAGDGRRLGIAIARMQVEGGGGTHPIDLLDARNAGLHPPESNAEYTWRWTTGKSAFQCPGLGVPAALVLEVPYRGQYWSGTGSITWPRGQRDPACRRLVFISGEPNTVGHVYRVLHAANAVRSLGHEAQVIHVRDVQACLPDIATADIVIIWRAPLEPDMRPVIDAARRGKAAVVLDMDDLMVDPRLARADVIDAIRFEGHDVEEVARLYGGIKDMLLQSDAGSCTTEELAVHMQRQQRPCFVIPNGFDADCLRSSRRAVRQRDAEKPDQLIRIGYAGGTRTHQADFQIAVPALVRVLKEHPECRLVLFHRKHDDLPTIDLKEFPALARRARQIEWREMVDLADLPGELARFDINIVPLAAGNMYCEAKSEIKYFESALVEVCTIASPTGPFRRAIRDGETGFLAENARDWYATLSKLVSSKSLRHKIGKASYQDVLWRFGPERRADLFAAMMAQLTPGRQAAAAFELSIRRLGVRRAMLPSVPDHKVIYHSDAMGDAEATVIIPLHNYAHLIKEALDSVWHQTVPSLDLIIIDDRSTDRSLAAVLDWVGRNGGRFNRMLVLQNNTNSGLGLTRNVGFAAAETPYVFPLDADNRVYPHCLSFCTNAIRQARCAYVYPTIAQFGEASYTMNGDPYHAARLASGNFIDAMALVAKSAWAAVGGYRHVRFGWEDYDFWCRMAEAGLWGERVPEVLAEYRVHSGSMLHTTTEIPANKQHLVADLQQQHPWIRVAALETTERMIDALDKDAGPRRDKMNGAQPNKVTAGGNGKAAVRRGNGSGTKPSKAVRELAATPARGRRGAHRSRAPARH